MQDKRPVGILCLPEYGSCQRADVKEWKKPFSFVLGRAEVQHTVCRSCDVVHKSLIFLLCIHEWAKYYVHVHAFPVCIHCSPVGTLNTHRCLMCLCCAHAYMYVLYVYCCLCQCLVNYIRET